MKKIVLAAVVALMAAGSASAQQVTRAQVEGTNVTVKGVGIYCGEIDLNVTQGSDGKNYLYDSDRNVSILIGATMPSLDSLVAKGQFCDYFPDCDKYEDIENYVKIITLKKRNDGLQVDISKLLEKAEIASSKGNFGGYKLKSVTITQMTTDDNKDFMPTATDPLAFLRFAYSHPANPWSFIIDRSMIYNGGSPVVIPTDSLEEYMCLVPTDGVMMEIDAFKMPPGATKESDLKVGTFKFMFIPDESGVAEIDAGGLKATITYEPGPSPLVDAYMAMVNAYDYFKNVHGRDSYDGKGAPVRLLTYVPGYVAGYMSFMTPMPRFAVTTDQFYGIAVSDFDPPYFIKVGTGGRIVLESGTVIMNHPVVERSTLYHEFTHLVTATSAHLGSGMLSESGSINESFSDILSISMMKTKEYGYGPETPWIVGGSGFAIGISNMRNMAEPKKSMDGLNPMPDTYKGQYWSENKYLSMGVQNKFYYLLCEGGKGTNDNNFSYDFTGIGVEKGARIAYLTLTKYCSPESNYSNIRDSWLKAAQELYGENGAEAQAVANAWDAVGVNGTSPSGINSITITTDNDEWYTIDGRKLEGKPTVKGIFINKGKKVVNLE